MDVMPRSNRTDRAVARRFNTRSRMKINKLIVGVGLSVLTSGLLSPVSAIAKTFGTQEQLSMKSSSDATLLAQATSEAALIAENRALLISNQALALQILAKVGGPAPALTPIPANAAPLAANQIRILNNRAIFRAIATKVGATIPALPAISASPNLAAQNVSLLLGNRLIVRAIATKIAATLPAPATPTGSPVQQVNQLLRANRAALFIIARRLSVPNLPTS